MATGDDLRSVMRRFPTGIAVVTVAAEQESLGLTVGSLVSLSLEPPLVGFAVARVAALHELLQEAGSCAISLLASTQEDVAAHFSRGVPPIAHWQGVAVRERADRAPLLEGALAWLDGRIFTTCETGDHTFFVVEIVAAEAGSGDRPLLRVDQRYVPA